MKSRIKVFYSFIFLFLFTTINAQNFEGLVKFKVTYEGETSELEYQIKDGKFRMEAPNGNMGGGVFLMNEEAMYVIMPGQQMYMEMPKDMPGVDSDEEMTGDEMDEPVRTGETKMFLGHEAEKWLMEDEEEDIEMWVAKDLGKFVMMNSPMQKDKPAWYKEIEDEGFFPMLVINKDKSGNEIGRYEVTELKEQSLSEDLFKVPAGFTKMNVPGMMKK